MKKRRNYSLRVIVLIWVFIYILAMITGTSLACFYTYESNRHLPTLILSDVDYYLENGEFTPKNYYYRNSSFIYTSSLELIDCHVESGSEMDFTHHAAKMVPATQENGTIYRMLFDSKLDAWLGLVVATTMNDGNIYFMIKPLNTLQTILIVLFCSLTVFLILSCIYSALIIRNTRRTEALRREYVDNVSHDLKSPIASIKALSESLYDGVIDDPDKQKKCYAIIKHETDRLETTVMNMLELSRTQAMGSNFEKSPVSACELFLPIVEKFSERCSELEIHFSAPINTDSLPTLFTNTERISVLTNVLLDNAVKFVSPGGHIRLEAENGHRHITVCVRDDGIGISKEEQKRIFERFYTGNLARNTNGSGLGLAIADEIASVMGEQLWVESAPGKGAAFYFTISCNND